MRFLFAISAILAMTPCAVASAQRTAKVGAYYFEGWYHDVPGVPAAFANAELRNAFPEREPIWGGGLWRGDTVAIMEQQIDLAADHGIAFFSFDWYWYGSPSATVNDGINSGLKHFMQASNRHRMPFNINIVDAGPTTIDSNAAWQQVADILMPYLADSQYLTVRGDPLVTNFNAAGMTQTNFNDFQQAASAAGIGPIPLFDAAELRAWCRDHEADMRRMKDEAQGFVSLHHRIPALYELITRPQTVSRLQDLLGPNVICFISDLINKPPGQTKGGSFHQDATFNPVDAGSAIVWLAMEDADVENGCMQFIPGSHQAGVVECDDRHFVVDPAQYGSSVPSEVKVGWGVFISDLLMHSSPPNRSRDRSRPGLTATYTAAEVKPHENANQWAVLCGGMDGDGAWKPHPRPA